MELRPAIFAGSWYPSRAGACEARIREFLAGGRDSRLDGRTWQGGIVPHAGWSFSGQIACKVIDLLREDRPVDLVVLFGMHLHPEAGNYMMPRGAWETPFGPLPVAEELADFLKQHYVFHEETANRFVEDNTIELQLPFVKYLLEPERILALGVPPAESSLAIGKSVAEWARSHGRRVKILGSTDLTHYGRNYSFSPKGTGAQALAWVRGTNDRRIIELLKDFDPGEAIREALTNRNACCAGAAATAVAALEAMGATASAEVAYATSHDKSPGDSFVGYAGIVYGP